MASYDLRREALSGLEEAKRRIAECEAANATSLHLSNLGLRELPSELLAAIAAHLPQLTSLDLGSHGIGAEGAKAIAAHLPQLTSLDLGSNSIGDEGAKAIGAQLTSLDLSGNSIGDEGAKAIAAHLPQLTSLNLGSNSIGAEGAKAIAAHLPQLTSLALSSNSIGDKGAKAIAAYLPQLTSLDLWNNTIGDEGAKAIAAHLPQLTLLNLAGNNIGAEGAKAIAAHLPQLTSLNLWHNRIGDEGAKAIAAHLPQLTLLNLAGNRIGAEGAKAIAAHLPQLTSLNLWYNRIGAEGAKAIAAHLPQLTSLDLGGNGVRAEGAKAIAVHLPHLTSLALWSNSIGDEGAKAIAAHLPQLTSLDLGNNSIEAEGAKALLDAFLALGSNRRLRSLNLRENGEIGLPKEVIEVTDADALLAAYESFRRSAQTSNLFPLNEAKLLVVGNEAVGKTSLVRFLVDGKPCDEDEKRTSGIAKRAWTPEENGIRLNVWDFAGQEITRGTHQYFLTERSLYLLVLEDRRQDDQSIYEWLKIILNRGRNSPIIVVINKSDEGKRELALPEEKLKNDYPQIAAFLRTSCKADEWSKRSMRKLQETIVKTLADAPELQPIRDEVPGGWLRVKENIARDAERRSVLELSDFIRLCERDAAPGETPGDAIKTEAEQRALLRVLHELGTIVAHGLSDNAMLPTVHILDPNWLTQGIYTILEHHVLHRQHGEFSRDQLKDWLPADKYPPRFFDFILSMMQDDEIELCFPLEARGKGWFLVPEALPVEGPDLSGFFPDHCLRFSYHYDLLPRGLMPRFIVKTHSHACTPPMQWRTGVVLNVENCKVHVEADREKERISIKVAGPEKPRRAALSVVRNALKALHDINPLINPQPFVPLPDNPAVEESYEYLLELERDEGSDYLYRPRGAARKYTVGDLLDGVRAGDAPKVLPAIPTSVSPGARRPEKPDRTWTYLAGFMGLAGAFGFWWLNVFGSQDLASPSRIMLSLGFGGVVYYIAQLHNPEYTYLRLLIAWLAFAGVGAWGRFIKGLLQGIPFLNYFLPIEREYSSAELTVWVTVFLALLAADFFSRHWRRLAA